MCLRVKSCITNSKYLDLSQPGISLRVNYSCGQCSECRSLKANDYLARSQAEWKYCVKNGGFAFFDTFTYSEKNVPVYSPSVGLVHGKENFIAGKSILTFDPEDYRKFFKRLRISLERSGYAINHRDANGKLVSDLKYFWVSEYGGRTLRPHYHCIFYVSIPKITPQIFNSFLVSSWQLGITDIEHSAIEKTVNGNGILHYVAKYVNKDCDYLDFLDSFCLNNDVPDFDKKHILQPFHRQSQGFGLDLINQQDYALMFNTNKIKISDNDGYHLQRIPLYIRRKLWYNLQKWSDGSLHWVLNAEGIKQHLHSIENLVLHTSDRLSTNFNNADDILGYSVRHIIDNVLGNRTVKDLANYIVRFRGKNFIPDLNITLDNNFDSVNNLCYGLDYSLCDITDNKYIFMPCANGFINKDNLLLTSDTLLRYHAINDSSYYGFEHFDYLCALNDLIQCVLNDPVDKKYFDTVKIKSRLKVLKDRYL